MSRRVGWRAMRWGRRWQAVLDGGVLWEGGLRLLVWGRWLWDVVDGGLGAGPRAGFVRAGVEVLRGVDGASRDLPHLGQARTVMAGEPATSGADDEGKETEGEQEGADDGPDHSPSDAAGGERSGSGDEHGSPERPRTRSQSCCGALLVVLVHQFPSRRNPRQTGEMQVSVDLGKRELSIVDREAWATGEGGPPATA